ncbi:MAG: UDP-N-acetylmuramoyl-L-alanyl-D-glutamate--2,6-diaminopimelate ligase [Gammaproteobacteria bacterium]
MNTPLPDSIRAPQSAALGYLLAGLCAVGPRHDHPFVDRMILGLSLNSRETRPGDLFLALPGVRCHGGDHVAEALRAGAVAVAIDAEYPEESVDQGSLDRQPAVPVYRIHHLRARAGVIAGRFFGQPSRQMRVIGVTGTNGKTSVAHYLAEALNGSPRAAPCGLIGTLGHGMWGDLRRADTTTPDAVTTHRLLAEMHARGAESVAMEVSSHGLEQGRVAGVDFDVAVFTNLSRDHLDYHGSMQSYGEAKRRLFQDPALKAAAVNLDDPYGRDIVGALPGSAQVFGYSLAERECRGLPEACVCGRRLETGASIQEGAGGLTLEVVSVWGRGRIESPLLGEFNAYNLLAALAALVALGEPFAEVLERLSRVRAAPGRLEVFRGAEDAPLAVVDYAHTPDGLEKALRAIRGLNGGQVLCVFGCGGDRDAGKRPMMGAIAESLADKVLVTSDNPRGEAPSAIINQILAGMRAPRRAAVEPDRETAIARAFAEARPGDVILVAGKGHEDYQEIAGQRRPFSDRDVVRRMVAATAGGGTS